MGLSATISVNGPDQLDDDETGASVLVDYNPALMEAADAFMHTAQSLCPVDSGYLLSSINAEIVGTNAIHVEATAPYAQYVEYGTSRMGAQPFFEPGVEAAAAVLGAGAQDALDEAAENLAELAASMLEGLYQGAVAAGFGASSNIVAGLMGIGMMILMFPLMLYAYGIMDAMQPGGPSGFDGPSSDNIINQVGGIDIIVD